MFISDSLTSQLFPLGHQNSHFDLTLDESPIQLKSTLTRHTLPKRLFLSKINSAIEIASGCFGAKNQGFHMILFKIEFLGQKIKLLVQCAMSNMLSSCEHDIKFVKSQMHKRQEKISLLPCVKSYCITKVFATYDPSCVLTHLSFVCLIKSIFASRLSLTICSRRGYEDMCY